MFSVHLTCRLQQHLFPHHVVGRLVLTGDVCHHPPYMFSYLF